MLSGLEMHQQTARPANAPKVIVFAGTAGINKFDVVEDFRACILRNAPHGTTEQSVPIFLAEDPQLLILQEFLADDPRSQRSMLERTYAEVARAISIASKKPDVRAILVPIHLSFMYADRIFSPLSWVPHNPRKNQKKSLLLSFLAAIKPDYVINLVDDVHYVQNRQKFKKVSLKLRDIFKWRELETLIADFAANDVIQKSSEVVEKNLYEHSPMIAVRHTCEMLYKYIFLPELPRIYTSFLISEMRNPSVDMARTKRMAQQVENLTSMLDREFCLFNPLTIDEKPLLNLLDAETYEESADIIKSTALANRWPIHDGIALTRDTIREIADISKADILEIAAPHKADNLSLVDRQIRARDIRLIDQSDAMVVYRPTNKLKPKNETYWGGGCLEEFLYAQLQMSHRTEFKIYVIVDETDHQINDKIGASDGPLKQAVMRIPIFSYKNLDDPANQAQAIEEVVNQIRADSAGLTRSRLNREVSAR